MTASCARLSSASDRRRQSGIPISAPLPQIPLPRGVPGVCVRDATLCRSQIGRGGWVSDEKKKRTAAAAAGHLFLGTRNGTRSAADAIAKPPVDRIITGLLTAVVVESQFFFAFAGVGRGNVISVEMLRSSPKRNPRDAAALVITSQTRTPCSDKWLLNALPNLAVARSIRGPQNERDRRHDGETRVSPSQRSAANTPSIPSQSRRQALNPTCHLRIRKQ